MRLISLSSLLLLTLALPSAAQEDEMTPPAALARYDRMVGNWTGAGTFSPAPGADTMPWTSVTTFTKILRGWAYQEDTRIDAEGMPAMMSRTLHAYDQQAEQFLTMGVTNGGNPYSVVTYWVDDDTLMGASAVVEEGDPVAERWFLKLEKDQQHVTVERAHGAGPWYVMVSGTMKRGGKGFDAAAGTADVAMAPPAEEMAQKPGFPDGVFRMNAKLIPLAGMPVMEIGGVETNALILGKHVLMSHVKGEEIPGAPMVYERMSYTVWDPQVKSFRAFTVSNSGEVLDDRGYRQPDGSMIFTSRGVVYGFPEVTRTIVTQTKDGYRVRSWRSSGAADPDISFDASFVAERKK